MDWSNLDIANPSLFCLWRICSLGGISVVRCHSALLIFFSAALVELGGGADDAIWFITRRFSSFFVLRRPVTLLLDFVRKLTRFGTEESERRLRERTRDPLCWRTKGFSASFAGGATPARSSAPLSPSRSLSLLFSISRSFTLLLSEYKSYAEAALLLLDREASSLALPSLRPTDASQDAFSSLASRLSSRAISNSTSNLTIASAFSSSFALRSMISRRMDSILSSSSIPSLIRLMMADGRLDALGGGLLFASPSAMNSSNRSVVFL
mmetsp:Transcript_3960/g.11251  ORF Transcript_3960/g.11251 Transcript_3960/m.11251 type:complete len:267 (-) Transcript_3960:163-963(-)